MKKMKMLKWFAVAVTLFGVSGLLLFIVSGFGPKHRETVEQFSYELPPESAPESVRNLPIKNIFAGKIDSDFFTVRLWDATRIDGFPCAAEWVKFTKSGQLAGCTLAEDVVIQDMMIPGGAIVDRDKELNTTYLFPKDTEIQDHLCMGKTRKYGIPIVAPTALYPSGRLKEFYSPSDVTIQGIPCRKANFGFLEFTPLRAYTPISLHENGNLRRCTLSNDTEIGGRSISAGKEILIAGDGQVTTQDDSKKRRMGLLIAGLFD